MSYFYCQPGRLIAIHALRAALEKLQEHERLAPDDPTLLQLKRSLMSDITELELKANQDYGAAA